MHDGDGAGGSGAEVLLTALPGLALLLPSTSALASGKEGAALVEPVFWMAVIVLVTFVTLVLGGGVLGALRASRGGESILRGSARGLLKGVVAFVVVGAVSLTLLTFLGILWVAYSFLQAYTLSPS
jgi:hypothetical protein